MNRLSSKIKVAIITNIITSYRSGFFDRLFEQNDLSVTVYCQDHMPGVNVTSIHEKYGDHIKIINFISAKKERIAWQFLPWKEIFTNYDVVFVGGNPRVLSDLLISTALHFSGKGIVHWTMAHSFRANVLTEKIRLLWSRLFKYIFVYTDAEVDFLRNRGFKNNFIWGMNNGLNQKMIDAAALKWSNTRLQQWRSLNKLENKVILLSCARLDAKNKFELVIRALPLMLAKAPTLIWCVIGDGDERNNLETMVKSAGLKNYVRFIGELYKEDELSPWFLSSDLFVHPAAIGLSLLHAFGYGLPVITHGYHDEHGPEYAAFESECTGRNFQKDNIESLASTIISLLNDRKALSRMRLCVLEIARTRYNVDIMVERFVTITRQAFLKVHLKNLKLK